MHSFSVEVAKEVGVNAAILLQGIKWWCDKNRANDKHFHDGLYWTYNSTRAWTELYPYLSKSAINTAIKKLEDMGYILTGNYNKSSYDRTKWFAITDEGLRLYGESIYRKSEMDSSEIGNRFAENGQPIPVINQLGKTVLSKDIVVDQISAVVSYLNEKLGTSYKPTTESTRKLINARLKEGFTLEDFKAVIDAKYAQWGNDPKMAEYLRPSTLFGTKFEGYLNSAATRRAPRTTVDLSVYDQGVREFIPIEEDTSWSS